MDSEYEMIFVKNFILKHRQDRFFYELSSLEKRNDALGRLNHNYDNIFVHKYMKSIPKPNSDYLEILNLLKSHGAKESCYVISWNKEIDGQYLSLDYALEKAVGFGMPSVISCLPGKLLYFESEQAFGPPPRFILKRE